MACDQGDTWLFEPLSPDTLTLGEGDQVSMGDSALDTLLGDDLLNEAVQLLGAEDSQTNIMLQSSAPGANTSASNNSNNNNNNSYQDDNFPNHLSRSSSSSSNIRGSMVMTSNHSSRLSNHKERMMATMNFRQQEPDFFCGSNNNEDAAAFDFVRQQDMRLGTMGQSSDEGELEREILESLASGDPGKPEVDEDQTFNFVGDIKRAFSPIKQIVYNGPRSSSFTERVDDDCVSPEPSDFLMTPPMHQPHAYKSADVISGMQASSVNNVINRNNNSVNSQNNKSSAPHPYIGNSSNSSSSSSLMSRKASVTMPKDDHASDHEPLLNSNPNPNPWPSAADYRRIFLDFLADETKYPLYTVEQLGVCKLTGTPKQPSWLYCEPRVGIFFFECEHLRGKAGYGFPKAEGTKKLFEWKKTSYINEVPRAKPLVSYITANGKPRKVEGNPYTTGFRMRIVKIANPDQTQYGKRAKQLVLCDIREAHELAKRQGPRPPKRVSKFDSSSTDGYSMHGSSLHGSLQGSPLSTPRNSGSTAAAAAARLQQQQQQQQQQQHYLRAQLLQHQQQQQLQSRQHLHQHQHQLQQQQHHHHHPHQLQHQMTQDERHECGNGHQDHLPQRRTMPVHSVQTPRDMPAPNSRKTPPSIDTSPKEVESPVFITASTHRPYHPTPVQRTQLVHPHPTPAWAARATSDMNAMPLSPLKRLSIQSQEDGASFVNGSPKGSKMQRRSVCP